MTPPSDCPTLDYERPGWHTHTKSRFSLAFYLLVGVVLITAWTIGTWHSKPRMGSFTSPLANDLAALKTVLCAYQVDTGEYPTEQQGLAALLVQPPGVTGWHGPYIDRIPLDPWHHPYIYHPPTSGNSGSDRFSAGIPLDPWHHPDLDHTPANGGADFEIFSAGPDGIPGTADDVH